MPYIRVHTNLLKMENFWQKMQKHKWITSLAIIGAAMGYMDGVISLLERVSFNSQLVVKMLHLFHVFAQILVPILLGGLVWLVIDLKAKTANRIFSKEELHDMIKDGLTNQLLKSQIIQDAVKKGVSDELENFTNTINKHSFETSQTFEDIANKIGMQSIIISTTFEMNWLSQYQPANNLQREQYVLKKRIELWEALFALTVERNSQFSANDIKHYLKTILGYDKEIIVELLNKVNKELNNDRV